MDAYEKKELFARTAARLGADELDKDRRERAAQIAEMPARHQEWFRQVTKGLLDDDELALLLNGKLSQCAPSTIALGADVFSLMKDKGLIVDALSAREDGRESFEDTSHYTELSAPVLDARIKKLTPDEWGMFKSALFTNGVVLDDSTRAPKDDSQLPLFRVYASAWFNAEDGAACSRQVQKNI